LVLDAAPLVSLLASRSGHVPPEVESRQMLSSLLKALEMLMAALKASPDQKRQAMAKDIFRIYLDLGDLIGRGRKILSLLSISSLAHRGVSISLLMQQHQVLQSLRERLSHGPVNYILALHLPQV
jgi:hypothetical protein